MARKYCLSITWYCSAPAHTPRGWGVAESGAIDHAASLRSFLELCCWTSLLPSLWASCDSDMEEFDSKDISTSKDEDCVPLGERLYLRRTAACPPSASLKRACRLCVGPAGVFSSGSASSSACPPSAVPKARLVCSATFRAAASRGLAGRLPIRSVRTLPRSLTAVWHCVPLATLNSSERQSYPQTFRPPRNW